MTRARTGREMSNESRVPLGRGLMPDVLVRVAERGVQTSEICQRSAPRTNSM